MIKINAKNISLAAGVFQQAVLVLIIRYSKTRHHDDDTVPYLTSVAIMMAEVCKLCLSYVLEVIPSSNSNSSNSSNSGSSETAETESLVVMSGNSSSPTSSSNNNTEKTLNPHRNDSNARSAVGRSLVVLKQMSSLNQESIKLIVPAVLYLLQNNLLFVALSHLSVPTYQLTNQGKLITTALISRVLLKKKISTMQYCAIILLGIGVAIVNLSEHQTNSAGTSGGQKEQNQWLGFLAVFTCCVTSGFAGVYFEYVLKTGPIQQSVHYRNFQLAFWSILFAIIHIVASTDMSHIQTYGLFQGFDGIVVVIIIAQALTGFIVSMMIKYADAVLKGFAISIAALVASVASIFLFHTEVNAMLFVGGSFIAISVKMYSSSGATASGRNEQKGFKWEQVLLPTSKSSIIIGVLLIFVFALRNIIGIHKTVLSSKAAKAKNDMLTLSTDEQEYIANTQDKNALFFNATSKKSIVLPNTQDKKISFFNAATNKTFVLPTDTEYIANELKPFDVSWTNGAKYLRNTVDITTRGKEGNCGVSLDVVAWLMDKVNERGGVLILAYGELIHFHREKDFVDAETGKYIDDDFDFWAPVEMMKILSELEPELFDRFGFTVRYFVNRRGYIVLAQVLASCGLLNLKVGKVQSSQPGIEIYPLAFKDDKGSRLLDLWQGNEFQSDLMYPPKHIQFVSTGIKKGTSITLRLQLPNAELHIMTCLYGNWSIPSSKHAGYTGKC